MIRYISLILLLFVCGQMDAQKDSFKPKDLVTEAIRSNQLQKPVFFQLATERNLSIPQEVKDYEVLSLDRNAVARFIESNGQDFIELNIPSEKRSNFELQLVEVDIHAADGYVVTQPERKTVKVKHGKHYRGIVKGNSKSLVAISVFEDEVMGFISEAGKPNLTLGKLKGSDTHIIYEDANLKDKLAFACDTAESDFEYSEADLKDNDDSRALMDCVRIYLEVDYDIYQDKGSNITSVTNFIDGLFNQVATMYANEQINVVLSPLNIWTQPSPYNSTSSSGMLSAFLANTGAFDGDLAQLLSYKASGGIAYVNGLCSFNPDFSKSFSSINSTYQNVPTYSWSVMVMTHEFGHLFGSQHTHSCAWNGNNTAIDGCFTTEGGCADPGIPSGGGTVMSYCHLTSVGINLNLGFGPQPGNLIRNNVENASCTQACSDDGGGDDGGNDGGDNGCTDTEAVLTLLTDNYPGETTWTLSDASGAVLYSGGPYSSQGQTITQTFCLTDGCYDFTINDSYGDGICCGYGQGSYDISIAGQSVVSGGEFNSVETVNFCAGSDDQPTCTDGIQNGNETGVDCGGPDCPACESCNDGIQNNGEEDVDCGGPNCDPCVQAPTCTDGIQNGNETGVDCGGSDCPACESCNDGIQNNGEEDVDCGGPNCDPCVQAPTCTDGIQNGNETGIDCGGPDCPACESCNDGIQNNGEEDVDCGGPNCDACETCEDDIQNGNETGIDCGGPDCEPCENDDEGEAEEVFAHYFETGWDGWQDGGSDCYRYSGWRSYEGQYSIRLRDNSGTASAMTSSSYDLSSYNGVELTFYFYPNSMENGEDFWLRYYNGSSWETVAIFTSGQSFQNNSFYVATVPILSNNYEMANNARFRFQCDASSNADRVYIDAVTVMSLSDNSLPSGEVKISKLNSISSIDEVAAFEDIAVAPNPASELLNLKINVDHPQNLVVSVIDVLGRRVSSDLYLAVEGDNTLPVDISAIELGTYFLKVVDSEGDQMVKRFIKIK